MQLKRDADNHNHLDHLVNLLSVPRGQKRRHRTEKCLGVQQRKCEMNLTPASMVAVKVNSSPCQSTNGSNTKRHLQCRGIFQPRQRIQQVLVLLVLFSQMFHVPYDCSVVNDVSKHTLLAQHQDHELLGVFLKTFRGLVFLLAGFLTP